MDAKELISSTKPDITKPLEDTIIFADMFKTIMTVIDTYEPKENQEFILNEIHYAFTKYVFDLSEKGLINEQQKDDVLGAFRDSLSFNFCWDVMKPTLSAKHFRNIIWYLKDPISFRNPMKTMAPEYILELHYNYKLFEDYINSPDFLRIMNARVLEYFEQDSIEGARSGHNNERKFKAVAELLEEIHAQLNPEYFALIKLVNDIRKEREEELANENK